MSIKIETFEQFAYTQLKSRLTIQNSTDKPVYVNVCGLGDDMLVRIEQPPAAFVPEPEPEPKIKCCWPLCPGHEVEGVEGKDA